jgi:hypothetical protein
MIRTVRTNSENVDFIQLVARLDNLLADLDGRDHDFYDEFNRLDKSAAGYGDASRTRYSTMSMWRVCASL